MESDVQKKAISKYNQSEAGKARNARYRRSKKGRIANARHAQTKKRKITNAHYARTKKGKAARARVKAGRKRDLGFKPINNWFEGCEGHHIDKENVLFIPAELHKSIRHSQDDLGSMKRINDAAFEWFYIEEVI